MNNTNNGNGTISVNSGDGNSSSSTTTSGNGNNSSSTSSIEKKKSIAKDSSGFWKHPLVVATYGTLILGLIVLFIKAKYIDTSPPKTPATSPQPKK